MFDRFSSVRFCIKLILSFCNSNKTDLSKAYNCYYERLDDFTVLCTLLLSLYN